MALIVERENEMQLSLCEVSVYGEPHLGSPCWSNPCGNGGSCKPDGCYYLFIYSASVAGEETLHTYSYVQSHIKDTRWRIKT